MRSIERKMRTVLWTVYSSAQYEKQVLLAHTYLVRKSSSHSIHMIIKKVMHILKINSGDKKGKSCYAPLNHKFSGVLVADHPVLQQQGSKNSNLSQQL
jgi:hypothetical protein